MLISQRKEGEAVNIGDDIEIRIISVGGEVLISIIAPRDVKVTTRKLSDFALENTMAAAHGLNREKPFAAPPEGEQCIVLSFPAKPRKIAKTDR